ncbi:carboxy terminal-processing peptidase [Spiribacter onubensis]|uniref:Carboxy terminal-processing peptidase n=1 Tax=Spiribacter onubensis TaxID=3122420 RepID=A0ABV3S7U4_9GAMM
MIRATITHALLAMALLFTQPALSLAAEAIEPEPLQERAGQVVGELLSRYHYNDLQTNDQLSEEVYRAYFDALDPRRFYFTAADLEAFADRSDRLDDEIRTGRLDTAYAIFERYRQRVNERSDHALDVLGSGLDFNSAETLELDRSDVDWAGSSEELDELWRKRVVNDALTQKLNGREVEEIKASLAGRYKRLSRTLSQYTAEDVFQVFMTAWAGEFDPHSSYMSPRTSENFDINMRLSLEGIGALLSNEGEFVEIVELIAGGPAETSGQLKAGDRIVGVGQEPNDIQDVVGWRLADVVDLIRGPKGSEVHLRILPSARGSDSRERVITLTRNTIELEEQAARAEVREVEREEGLERIGVIEIPAFYADFGAANAGDEDYRSTTRDVSELLASEALADIDGLVIDLRGNAGGSLEEAVRMTGLFIDQGPVVQVHRSNGRREVLTDPAAEPAIYDGPLGVLVDGRSASASEIFAAAMQDYGRGVVMGDQTFGKGTVQTLVGLERFGVGDEQTPSGRLKLTIAKFYRINGESTQLEGVTPDLEMPYPQASDSMGERAADNALPWDTIRSADYVRIGRLDGLINTLRRHHQQRLRLDPALQAVAGEASRLEAERDRTRVSLNEAERRAEIDAAEAARLAAVNAQLTAYGREPLDSLDGLEPDMVPDVLLDEAVEVVADLAELQAGGTPRMVGRLSPVQAAAR